MKRDQQRQKLYDWERKFHNRQTFCRNTGRYRCSDEMTMKEIHKLCDKVTRHFKMRKIDVDFGHGRRRAYSYGGEIALPKWARQPVVVLHEMAHEVHRYLGRPLHAVHGREFLGIEMYLLVKFAGLDIKTLVRTANDARLEFDSIATVKERIKNRNNR